MRPTGKPPSTLPTNYMEPPETAISYRPPASYQRANPTIPHRQALRYIIRNTTLPQRTRAQAQLQLSQMHCYTRSTQINNRCIAGGKSRGVFSDFRLARVSWILRGHSSEGTMLMLGWQFQFRMNALEGSLPGVKKASWWRERDGCWRKDGIVNRVSVHMAWRCIEGVKGPVVMHNTAEWHYWRSSQPVNAGAPMSMYFSLDTDFLFIWSSVTRRPISPKTGWLPLPLCYLGICKANTFSRFIDITCHSSVPSVFLWYLLHHFSPV